MLFKILNLQNRFEAELHNKRFVDLILNGERTAAIKYLRENVPPEDFEACPDLKKAMTLMVEDTKFQKKNTP